MIWTGFRCVGREIQTFRVMWKFVRRRRRRGGRRGGAGVARAPPFSEKAGMGP